MNNHITVNIEARARLVPFFFLFFSFYAINVTLRTLMLLRGTDCLSSWRRVRVQCFVLPSGPYGWTSVWCPQPCLLPWPTTWICGRPTRPWLAMPWTRSPWISCCPPASTSRWTSRERPQSSTSSWWVLSCITKTALRTQTLSNVRVAVVVGWEYFSLGPPLALG